MLGLLLREFKDLMVTTTMATRCSSHPFHPQIAKEENGIVTLRLSATTPRRARALWSLLAKIKTKGVVVEDLDLEYLPTLIEHLGKVEMQAVELNLQGLGGWEGRLLADFVERSNSLRVLSLQWNDIGNLGAAALSRALKTNTALLALNLSHNGIDDQGLGHLCDALAVNRSLKRLNLYWNQITPKGVAQLVHTLNHTGNSVLSEVDIQVNQITQLEVAQFAQQFARIKLQRTIFRMRTSRTWKRLPQELVRLLVSSLI
ncbi:hypothetical protein BASA81_008118 [Batrachochytrium salamandrivorans]|nr:hypothetical protein BASA81_008118 [Batrachochytrium salamandrivorans]